MWASVRPTSTVRGPGARAAKSSGRPEAAWDATQPHVPFPMLGETQAISMTSLLDEPQAHAAASGDMPTDGSDPAAPGAASDRENSDQATSPPRAASTSTSTSADAPPVAVPSGDGRDQTHDEQRPLVEAVEDSQPVPVVAADAEASPFEIDEVEALPDEAEGVLDLHEGASDFVPVTSADRPHHESNG